MKILSILFFLSLSLASAQNLDVLLQEYEKKSDLSEKTKDESAGNLIVYTRDDLQRMQVETLRDILKSLRFFSYIENRLGQSDILNVDPITYYSKSVRVYLNEHELLSPIAGSGLIMFGNMEMDFIDHIEIYEGFPSFDFGIEPATVVIRLYTKIAEHDEGGRLKATLGTYGANKQNAYYAHADDEYSYFVYLNRLDDKQDSYEHNGEILKRDRITERFYGSLNNKQHHIELHATQSKGDAFIGSLVGSIPQETVLNAQFFNIALHSKFLDDSLELKLSYINEYSDYFYQYSPLAPIFLPSPDGLDFIPITSFNQSIEEEAFTAMLQKEWKIGIHDISVGLQYRYKYFDLTDIEFSIPTDPISQAYYTENVYSIFLQDMISLSDTQMITLSIMDQIYQRIGEVDDPNTLQLRLGYIYSSNAWVAKTFLSYQQFVSEPYMTISPHYGNAELDSETYYSIFQELSYKNDMSLSKIILGYGLNRNLPILSSEFIMKNSDEDLFGFFTALEYTLFFRDKDKLELQASYTHMDSAYNREASQHYNYIIRMLNTISSVDIFNEMVIHHGYYSVSTGYDYSAGLRYHVTQDFKINLKGENIFDSGQEWSYVNKINPITQDIADTIEVPIIERRFWIGMEYLF